MARALPTGHGVVVYAENTWAAMQARNALEVEWDLSAAETRSSGEIKDEILAALDAEPTYNVNKADRTAVKTKIDGAATVLEKTFYFPLLAHAPMEPLNCTIEQTAEGDIVLHDGAQMPTGPHMAYQQIFELPAEKIQIKSMLAGGSFGRRATPDADYQVEAALAFIMTDRSRPVKLVWDREDDIRGGYYRPAAGHKVRVGLDETGAIIGWDHQVAGQSIMKGTDLSPLPYMTASITPQLRELQTALTPFQVRCWVSPTLKKRLRFFGGVPWVTPTQLMSWK